MFRVPGDPAEPPEEYWGHGLLGSLRVSVVSQEFVAGEYVWLRDDPWGQGEWVAVDELAILLRVEEPAWPGAVAYMTPSGLYRLLAWAPRAIGPTLQGHPLDAAHERSATHRAEVAKARSLIQQRREETPRREEASQPRRRQESPGPTLSLDDLDLDDINL